MTLEQMDTYIKQHTDSFLEQLFYLLKQKSVSTDGCVWQNKSAELCSVNVQSPALI